MNESNCTFKESQSFNVFIITAITLTIIILIYFSTNGALLSQPAPAIMFMCIGFGISIFLLLMRLHYKIENNVFMYKSSPLHLSWRNIPISSITEVASITYRPIVDYGGWGIRYGYKGEWAYNMRGNKGVRIKTIDGKRIMFGSQKADELQKAIETIMKTESRV